MTNETALSFIDPATGEVMAWEEIKASVPAYKAVSGEPTLIDDKAELVGKEFVVYNWQFRVSADVQREVDGVMQPAEFVSVEIVDKNGDRYVFNDGSTGIMEQLRRFGSEVQPFYCATGLRRSDYTIDTPQGKSRATTFYFA